MCLWAVVKWVHLSKFTEELLNFFSSEVKSSQIRLERKCQRAFNAFCANFVLLPELLQNKHENMRIIRAVAALFRTCVLFVHSANFSYSKIQCSWHLLNAVVILAGRKKTSTRIKRCSTAVGCILRRSVCCGKEPLASSVNCHGSCVCIFVKSKLNYD